MVAKFCSIEGCVRKYRCKGFRESHYNAWRKYGDPEGMAYTYISNKDERFNSSFSINKETGCWDWTGKINKKGHGEFAYTTEGVTNRVGAHRYSWAKHNPDESLDSELTIHHKCFNPKCVNPDHLEQMSIGDNVRESVKAGRWSKTHQKAGAEKREAAKTHCPNGHALDEHLIIYRKARRCKTCLDLNIKKSDQSRKERRHSILWAEIYEIKKLNQEISEIVDPYKQCNQPNCLRPSHATVKEGPCNYHRKPRPREREGYLLVPNLLKICPAKNCMTLLPTNKIKLCDECHAL